MSAEHCRAAAQNGHEHFQMQPGEPNAALCDECRPRVATGERHGPWQSETPLFPSPRGGRYSITALRGAFHDALKIAGIERTTDSRIRLHDLRHYAEFRTMPSRRVDALILSYSSAIDSA